MKASAGRILVIVQNLPVPFDRRVWLESKTLRNAGYQVSVICPKSIEFHKSFEITDDIAIYRYAMPVNASGILGYFFEFIYAWLATAFLSVRVFRKRGFDLIHACNPPDTFFLLAVFYKLFGVKFIFDHHDLSPEMFMAKFPGRYSFLLKGLYLLEWLTLKTADAVLCTNESYRQVALTRGKKKERDVFVVRTGPDLTRLHPQAPDQTLKRGKKFLVVYLGEMCPQDGVDYLLRAVADFVEKRDDTVFTLVGGGPALEDMKKLARQLDLAGKVNFTGRISDQELNAYLSTADVCVDPDPYSEWSDKSTMNKVMEYMVFSKPIVAFDLMENRRSAQKAAVYVKPNDTIAFYSAIQALLDDPQKRHWMGTFGRNRIFYHLSWENGRLNLLRAYHHVTTRPADVECTIADSKKEWNVQQKKYIHSWQITESKNEYHCATE